MGDPRFNIPQASKSLASVHAFHWLGVEVSASRHSSLRAFIRSCLFVGIVSVPALGSIGHAGAPQPTNSSEDQAAELGRIYVTASRRPSPRFELALSHMRFRNSFSYNSYDTSYIEEPEPENSVPDSVPNNACPAVGNPIVVSSGNKVEFELDFRSEGEDSEMPLIHSRTYSLHGSSVPTPGGTSLRPFGYQWRSNLEYYLRDNVALRPDGTAWTFSQIFGSPNQYQGTGAGRLWRMTRLSGGASEVRGPNGEVETYNASGRITRKTNAHGISWTFTYNSDRLYRVTHDSGRYIELTWSGSRVSRLRKPDGTVVDFGYTSGRLDWTQYSGTFGYRINYHSDFLGRLAGKSFDGARYSTFAYAYDDAGDYASSSEHAGGVNRTTFSRSFNAQTQRRTVTTTNAYDKTTRYHYNALGQLEDVEGVASAFCLGGFVSTTYNAQGLPDSRVDAEGVISKYEYFPNGRIRSQTDAFGTPEARTTQFEWQGDSSRPTKITVAGVSETVVTYTPNNRIAREETRNLTPVGTLGDAQVTTYTYTYHSNGMPSEVVIDGPIIGTSDRVTYRYAPNGNLSWIQNNAGHRTTFADHDGLGRPRRITGPNGEVVLRQYDASGLLASVTQENASGSDTTLYRYSRGLLSEVEDSDGEIEYFTYDDARRLTGTFRIQGSSDVHHRELTLNAASDVVTDTVFRKNYRPDSTVRGFLDNALKIDSGVRMEGWACSRHIPANLNIQIVAGGPLGAAGATSIASGVANVVHESGVSLQCESGLNAHRYRISISDAVASQHAGKVLYAYAASPVSGSPVMLTKSGQIYLPSNPVPPPPPPPPCQMPPCDIVQGEDELTLVDGEGPDAGIQSASWQPTNQFVRRTRYAYDELGRVRSVLGNYGQRTDYTYDRNDRIVSERDALNRTTVYRYNRHGEIREVVDPGQGVTTFGHDRAGRVVSVRDPRGNTTTYQIDGFGRVHRVQSPDTGITIHHYDATGRLAWTRDANLITRHYTYDGLSRVSSISEGGEVQSFEYDNCPFGKGQLCRVQDSESDMTYEYEWFGRLTRQLAYLPEGGITDYSFTYDHRGRQTQRTNNRNEVAFRYNYARGRLASIEARLQRNSTVWTTVLHGIQYDPAGSNLGWTFGNTRQTHRNFDWDGRLTRLHSPGGMDRNYAFDNANRLTSITHQQASFNQSFAYTPISAVRQVTGFSAETFTLRHQQPDQPHAVGCDADVELRSWKQQAGQYQRQRFPDLPVRCGRQPENGQCAG